MARKIKSKVTNIEELIKKETIIQSNMGDELRDAMLNYAIEVITDRALPNIYDGLKPVQRRILYAGLIKKYFSNGKFIKCAKYVGDVIGELNPHGEYRLTYM